MDGSKPIISRDEFEEWHGLRDKDRRTKHLYDPITEAFQLYGYQVDRQWFCTCWALPKILAHAFGAPLPDEPPQGSPAAPQPAEWLTVKEVAAEASVHPDTVRGWCRSLELEAKDVSSNPGRNVYRIPRDAWESFRRARQI